MENHPQDHHFDGRFAIPKWSISYIALPGFPTFSWSEKKTIIYGAGQRDDYSNVKLHRKFAPLHSKDFILGKANKSISTMFNQNIYDSSIACSNDSMTELRILLIHQFPSMTLPFDIPSFHIQKSASRRHRVRQEAQEIEETSAAMTESPLPQVP
jgi:hypothetical protein